MLCFTAGLLAKATGVMLPVVLLLLDVYPLRRVGAGRSRLLQTACLVGEKTPHFLLSLGFGLLAVYGQEHEATMLSIEEYDPLARIMQAAYGLCFYVWKTLLPVGLSPLYLRDRPLNPLDLKYLASAAVVPALTMLALLLCRRRPWLLVGWAAYAILVAPMLGFAQAGLQIVADRYAYLATMPFAVLAGAGCFSLSLRGRQASLPARAGLSAVASLLLLVLALLTFRQTCIWRDTLTLWGHALELDPNHYLAYSNRGSYHVLIGQREKALADYNAAIRSNPEHAISYNNRGKLLHESGDLAGALDDYNKAIVFARKGVATIFNNRGNVFQDIGQPAGALADYARAIEIDPDFWEGYANRARLLLSSGDQDGAVKDYAEVIRLHPSDVTARIDRGFIYMRKGAWSEAMSDFNVAIELAPAVPITYLHRGIVHKNLGNISAAAQDFAAALERAPPNWSYRRSAEDNLREARNVEHRTE
jgi:tetratricopeptide (TPR) repeat protein